MASSEDEVEDHPQSVSNYHFVDQKDVPVSFSVLRIQWTESENTDGKNEEVFLHGVVDNGLQKLFMQVVAWKFDISNAKPEISVLSKDRRWIKLQKPRKSFEDTIRTTITTVHFLHYVGKNPETSAKSVWDYLSKVLSYYEVRPSQNDLLNHLPLIGEAVKRHSILAKSKLLLMVLENPWDVKLSDEGANNLARPAFIVDNIDDDTIDEAAEESDEDDDLFDSVCVLCDNGGKLLCCDGKCMRSFHATEEDGAESICDSLGLTQKEVDEVQNFYCKNCECNQHQCFACGKLGSSDTSSGAEVFRCENATCGRFYHPQCVAKLRHREDEFAAKELEKIVADGGSFTCPIHFCCICKQRENKKEHELQFAICRRCPKSYHRKCLPRKIAFEDIEEEGIITRAWEGLLPSNRILIYCLKHEIDDELGTPIRDHIRFPKINVQEINSSLEEETKPPTQDRVILNKSNVDLDDSSCKRSTPKESELTEKASSGKVGIKKKSEKIISGSNILRKRKANGTPGRHLNVKKKSISKETEKLDGEVSQSSLGKKLYALMTKSPGKIEPGKHDDNVANKTLPVKPTKNELSSSLPQLDAESERRMLALFKEAASSITLDDVLEKHKVASTHTYSLRNVVEKTITAGKLEGSVDAVRTALRKLEEGRSIEDSEAVCDPDVLNQIFKWRDKLKVYLAPFLYGNRYTSYGRHFTQVEKLEGIVDRLHWYVQNGDTIVDFCCGANDFSILMKKKLEETGKKCFFKNYDLLPTKNDFNFEMRDWMTVQLKELPKGSQLIMGLNPPFGVKAVLANKFIEKALEFQPKLLILVVPPETQRLDKKRPPYDLLWEDEKFLSGKSFYLPGSVDVNDRQMEQWNVRPPLLYLWSRCDWTDKHKAIAQEHGHMPSQHDALMEKNFDGKVSPADHPMDDNHGDNLRLGHDLLKPDDDPEGGQASRNECQKENLSHGNFDDENQVVHEQSISKSDKTSWKRKHTEENDGIGRDVVSPANKQAMNESMSMSAMTSQKKKHTEENVGIGRDVVSPANKQAVNESISKSDKTSWKRKHTEENDGLGRDVVSPASKQAVNDMHDRVLPHSQQPHVCDGRSLAEGFQSKPVIFSSHVEVSDNASRHYESTSCSNKEFGAAYGGTQHWPSVATSLSDFGDRNLEEHHRSLPGGSSSSFGYSPYTMEEGKYWGQSDLRQQIRMYGMQEPDFMRRSYLSGENPAYGPMGTSYGQLGSDPRSSYINTSAMQRYAPRLDESNHVRMRNLGPEPPTVGRNDDNFGRGVPPQPGYGSGLQGFSPSPYRAYSRRNSAGWLNE